MAKVVDKPIPRCNKSELMVILDVSRVTINKQLNKDGAPRPDSKGKYNLAEVVKYWISVRSRDAAYNGDHDERTKKVIAERKLIEIKLAEAEGHMVNVDEVCVWLQGQLSGMKKQLMSLPSVLTPALVRAKSKKVVNDILTSGVRDALSSLQEYETSAS